MQSFWVGSLRLAGDGDDDDTRDDAGDGDLRRDPPLRGPSMSMGAPPRSSLRAGREGPPGPAALGLASPCPMTDMDTTNSPRRTIRPMKKYYY